MAKTDRIEIRPGIYMDVSSAYQATGVKKKKAMLLRTDISDSERRAIMEALGPDRRVRYTQEQLDHATQLSRSIGSAKAAKQTGVNVWRIRTERRILAIQGKWVKINSYAKPGKTKYTEKQKRDFMALVRNLTGSKQFTRHKAFAEAGKRMNMNGQSLYEMHRVGLIK